MKNSLKYLNNIEKAGVEQFVKSVNTAFDKDLIKITIFGSKIRGDYTKYSDIDILVVIKNRNINAMDKIAEITNEINLKFDISLSPVIFSAEEYRMNKEINSPFPIRVEAEGVTL